MKGEREFLAELRALVGSRWVGGCLPAEIVLELVDGRIHDLGPVPTEEGWFLNRKQRDVILALIDTVKLAGVPVMGDVDGGHGKVEALRVDLI